MKTSDEYIWPEYTKEYKAQLLDIVEKDKQDFFISGFDSFYGQIMFKDNLHNNWKEIYAAAYRLRPSSIYECGCGAGYHLKNLSIILPGAEISGCDLLQSQLDLAKEFSNLSDTIYNSLKTINLTSSPVIEKQYEFVFSHAVVMHLSTYNAINFLKTMRDMSSKYVLLIEGEKNHKDWDSMRQEVFRGWKYTRLNRFIDNGILYEKIK